MKKTIIDINSSNKASRDKASRVADLLAAPADKLCDHCGDAVNYLAAFPATLAGTGTACLDCYKNKVDRYETDASRLAHITAAFGGGRK